MMKKNGIHLSDVQTVYRGPEGDLWELVMGEQIHIGGLASSRALAAAAGIGKGSHGIDLCCCSGAGMRFLLRFCDVATMHGVDATETVIERGRERNRREGVAERIEFTLADACDTGLPGEEADFVWGEDAWCYVEDKPGLIAEATRLVKGGGKIAFTDWVEGPAGLSEAEAERFLSFMKFPSVLGIAGWRTLLTEHGCEVEVAEDTGQFARHVALYLDMLGLQLSYDALRIIDFDTDLMEAMGGEMAFLRDLAQAGKIAQGRFVASKA